MSTSAMHVAKTGLTAQQYKMQVIANNLANVNTTGFKRDRANFESLFYQVVKNFFLIIPCPIRITCVLFVSAAFCTQSIDQFIFPKRIPTFITVLYMYIHTIDYSKPSFAGGSYYTNKERRAMNIV